MGSLLAFIALCGATIFTFYWIKNPQKLAGSKQLYDRYRANLDVMNFDFPEEPLRFDRTLCHIGSFADVSLVREGLYIIKRAYDASELGNGLKLPLDQGLLIPWNEIHVAKRLFPMLSLGKFMIGSPTFFTVTCSKKLAEAIGQKLNQPVIP